MVFNKGNRLLELNEEVSERPRVAGRNNDVLLMTSKCVHITVTSERDNERA